MKVLIFGAQTNIGEKLIMNFSKSEMINVVALAFPGHSLRTIEKQVVCINGSSNMELIITQELDIEESIHLAMKKGPFDYVINCQGQPFPSYAKACPQKELDEYFKYSIQLLEEINRSKFFDGLFINLSSFAVYGNAPNGIPLQISESRFEIVPAKEDKEIESEELFGYDSAYGISEKMYYAPKDVDFYGLQKLGVERMVQEYFEGQYLNLRLPYMLVYNNEVGFIEKYGDRINVILKSLSKSQKIISTADNKDKAVYDFLSPEYVAAFIFNLISKGEKIFGTYNMSGVSFSELELLKILQDFSVDIEWLEETPDSMNKSVAYYSADDRKLRFQLEGKETNLPNEISLRHLVISYLNNSE